MNWRLLLVWIFALIGLITLRARADFELPPKIIPVPLIRQATNYSCGPASMLAVLHFWNVSDEGESDLYAPMKTTEKDGTDPINMLKYAKEIGLKAELRENLKWEDLEKGVARGETIIVDYQAWADPVPANGYKNEWESGHYSVVVGITESRIYFMDPSLPSRYGFLEKADFLDRWHDYETRNGKKVETLQLALFLKGETPAPQYPMPFGKVE